MFDCRMKITVYVVSVKDDHDNKECPIMRKYFLENTSEVLLLCSPSTCYCIMGIHSTHAAKLMKLPEAVCVLVVKLQCVQLSELLY